MDSEAMQPTSEEIQLTEEKITVSEAEDRISHLPDFLLHDILSSLPTKDAVATSVLSTKWKYMWTSVDSLDINEGLVNEDPAKKKKFADFVKSVLLKLQGKSHIKKFHLKCKNHDESPVNAWVYLGLKLKPQTVDINICQIKPADLIVLPTHICKSESVTVMKLQSNHELYIPCPLSLPNVRVLHLHKVCYPALLSDKPLICSCPLLSELILDQIKMNDFPQAIVIPIPSVKILKLYDVYRDTVMKIIAENLVSFVYKGGMSNDIFLCDTNSIIDAYVEITPLYAPREIGPRASRFLQQLSNVKCLAVSSVTISTLARDPNIFVTFPTFQKVTYLELSTSDAISSHYRLVLAFIHRSPNLRDLVFDKEAHPKRIIDRSSTPATPNGGSSLSQLRTVVFKRFNPNMVTFHYIKTLLEYAPELEKMTIHPSRELLADQEKHTKFREVLFSVRKLSNQCVIVYN
ncbi:hypothetical protein ACHQM5_003666 [Ranunculus cassubicifolius]